MPEAALQGQPLPRNVEAVVVLLHGASVGRSGSTSWLAPAPLRMSAFVEPIRRRSRRRIGVLRLRHPDRDWREVYRGAHADTARLLQRLERERPELPIALVGHSNGGRVALRLASDHRVSAVVALAPWITPYDRIAPRREVPILMMHGERDTITSPELTRKTALSLQERGFPVEHETVRGDNHALLTRAAYWHRRTADFLVEHLLP